MNVLKFVQDKAEADHQDYYDADCLLTDYEIRDSKIHGKGIFTKEAVTKGKIICFWAWDTTIVDEGTFLEKYRNDFILRMTGVRWIGRYFIGNTQEKLDETCFFNHSDNPNILYHCGVCIAKKDLAAGTEMTVDYRYFSAESQVYDFGGKKIKGYTARESLLKSSKELIDIIESIPDWPDV